MGVLWRAMYSVDVGVGADAKIVTAWLIALPSAVDAHQSDACTPK